MALNLTELQQLLDTAKTADALKADLRRALRKVSNAITTLQTAVEEMEGLLADDYQPQVKERKARGTSTLKKAVERDTEAPYGRKKDGTPKQRPGRAKAE